MPAVRMSAPAVRSSPPARSGGRRARKKGRPVPGARLRGLRWLPVPLALLAAALGVLVFGSLQGQAAANLASHPNEAGGLSLTVDRMLWMSNDMAGSGNPSAAPPPGDSYSMPSSMMPGMQPAGDDRLRVEVDLGNVSGSVQQYAMTDFTLSAPGGKTWQVNGQEHSSQPGSATLQPGFRTTIDVYFDIPAANSKHLTLHWSRGGRTISMPVNTSGPAGGANMHM